MSNTNQEKELLKRQNRIRFVEAAQELIEAEGPHNASIRKIAERAGFHNSTIYLYFKDVDQLMLLASLKYFNEYSRALSELSTKKLPPVENFMAIWDFFAQAVFRRPQIFYNFFFGKHSDNLTEIMRQYYDLFPEEKEAYSPEIEDMYYGKNIQERCLKLLAPLAGAGTRVSQENLHLVNDMIVSFLRYLLEQKCQNPGMDSGALTDRLLQMLNFIIL